MKKYRIKNYVFYFRLLTQEIKDEILMVCIRNDARYYYPLTGIDAETVITYVREKTEEFQAVDIQICEESFVDNYIRVRDYVENMYQTFPEFIRAEFVNSLLQINNICPMLNYAFDRWYYSSDDSDSQHIIELAELSVTCLYRIIPLEKTITNNVLGKGAYGILRRIQEKVVEKIPMNYAAFLFANEEEWENFQILKHTDLVKNIPILIAFDMHSKKLVREYILGMTGHELLLKNQMDENKINSLKDVFLRIRQVEAIYGIRLDIHPANFVWSDEKSQWFLFDLGSVPYIGFDYYPESFDTYYEKIWKERLERMKKFPIRSVEL